MVYDTPEQHPRVTEHETDYIHQSLGSTVSAKKVNCSITSPRCVGGVVFLPSLDKFSNYKFLAVKVL